MTWKSHSCICTKRKQLFQKMHASQCLLQHHLQGREHGAYLDVHKQRNGKRRCGIYITWDITQRHKKNKILPFEEMWVDLMHSLLFCSVQLLLRIWVWGRLL